MSDQRLRSPRYPSMPLGEAVDQAKKLFKGDGMNAVDREVAAGHIGYSGLNGASAQAIATLIQYGLLEAQGKGQVRLTALALDIIEPQRDGDRAKSLQEAAWTPRLFAELRERFPSTVPSEGNLRAFLIRQQFQASALKSLIPAYLKTCEYLVAEGASESHGQPAKSGPDSRRDQASRGGSSMEGQAYSPLTAVVTPPPSDTPQAGVRREVFGLDEGEVVITLPNRRLSADSMEDLDAWLKIVARKLRRMAAVPRDASLSGGQESVSSGVGEVEDEPS